MQTNLGLQRVNGMLSNIYKLIYLHFLAERVLRIEENLQFNYSKDNFFPRAISHTEQKGELEPILVDIISSYWEAHK